MGAFLYLRLIREPIFVGTDHAGMSMWTSHLLKMSNTGLLKSLSPQHLIGRQDLPGSFSCGG